MKKFTCFHLLCIILLLVFGSCSKQEFLTHSNLQNAATANTAQPNHLPGACPYPCTDTRCKAYLNGYCGVADTIAVKRNLVNINDSVGQIHNNGVSSIFPNINSTNNLDSLVLANVKAYAVSLGYNADSVQSFYDSAVAAGYFPYSQEPELDSLGNTMYANGALSSYGNSYVQQIYNYANEYLNTDTITIADYNSFANSLISLESTITNDSRLSSAEKQTLLSSCSVARYSASYWGNFINNSSSGGIMPSVARVQLSIFKKLKNWMRIVIGDIGGAIVGIPGGGKGIITGAIGGSITTAASLDYSEKK